MRMKIAEWLEKKWVNSCWTKLFMWAQWPKDSPFFDVLGLKDSGLWCISKDLVEYPRDIPECATCWCGKMHFHCEEPTDESR